MDKNNNVIWKNLSEIGFSKYEVSNDGYVRNASTKKVLAMRTSKSGYRYVSLIKDSGKVSSRSVSAFMLKVFNNVDVDFTHEVILFKDLDPNNHHIDNLHVFDYNDTDYTYSRKGIEIIATNLDTGKKRIFAYACEASKFFNTVRETLYRIIAEDRYIIKDNQRWKLTDRIDVDEAVELFKEYEQSLPGEVWYSMHSENNIAIFHYISNYSRIRHKHTIYNNRRVVTEYGDPKLIVSLLSTDKNKPTSKHCASLMIKYVKGMTMQRGKQRIVYKDGNPENVLPENLDLENITFNTKDNLPKRVRLTNIETNEVEICKSISEAERLLKYAKGSLVTSLRRNPDKIYRGYRIERI